MFQKLFLKHSLNFFHFFVNFSSENGKIMVYKRDVKQLLLNKFVFINSSEIMVSPFW